MSANAKQQEAITLIKQGKNVFLTGPGGCGKSWVIEQITCPDTIVVAPTGVAALNVKGSTCHSAFGMPIGLVRKMDVVNISRKVRQRFDNNSRVKRIILDEVSMLRSDYLDLIDMKLKKIRGNNKPFGGIQVVVVGDFFQLPPIVSENEKEHFYEQYETPFAFGAKCWDFSTVELTEVVRQNDLEQVALLNNIRKGISTKESLDKVRGISLPHHNKDMVFLCCYNNDASKINRQQYHQINAKEYVFDAHTSGNWGKEEPSPLKLRVKVGMKVIMCSNNPSQGYVNGDRGRIEHVTDDWNVYVRLDNGTLVKVDHAVWEKYSYNKTGGTLNKEVVASYRQLPIKYGWAVSVHKSQGMTLDGVTIDVGHGCFSHGQLYVALSRVKDLSNIYLMNNITEEDVIIEQEVRNFYES